MDISYSTQNSLPVRQLDLFRPREPGRVTLQIATTPALLETVYRLRHDSYVAQGFLEPKISGLFMDEWDRLPHFYSALSYVDDQPAASVRISHCTPAGPAGERTETTAMEIFRDEIINLAKSFRLDQKPAVMLEMSRLVRSPEISETNSDPLFAVFRLCRYSMTRHGVDMLISAVRRHHIPFYKRMGFQKITEPRPYPKLKFETALMVCFGHSFPAVQRAIPIFQGVDERDSVYGPLFAGERVRIFDEMPARAVVR
jgi:hypothetical protein